MVNKYHRVIGGKMVPLQKTTASGSHSPAMGEPYRMTPVRSSANTSSSAGYIKTGSSKGKTKKPKSKRGSGIKPSLRSY